MPISKEENLKYALKTLVCVMLLGVCFMLFPDLNITNDKLLLPIPQHEIDTNTQLVIPQNPGY